MNDVFLPAGLGLGALVVIAYALARGRAAAHDANLAQAVLIFLAVNGLCAGIKVCTLAMASPILAPLGTDRTYVFLGGLAVAWVSLQTVILSFRDGPSSARLPNIPLHPTAAETDAARSRVSAGR